ncbi:MAG: SCO family protein, partial [Proteobacteria bacterium]|nr:SCO family protein [Pseudomonadota bacterium]
VFASRVEGATADDYMEDHSSYVYLMSPDNQLLEVLSADETAEGMINKIKLHSR